MSSPASPSLSQLDALPPLSQLDGNTEVIHTSGLVELTSETLLLDKENITVRTASASTSISEARSASIQPVSSAPPISPLRCPLPGSAPTTTASNPQYTPVATYNFDPPHATAPAPTTSAASSSQFAAAASLDRPPPATAPPSAATVVVKVTCEGERCNSCQVSRLCVHRRCKRCCLLIKTPCGFKSHDIERNRRPIIPQTSADPFALSRPPPAIPYDRDAVSQTPAGVDLRDTNNQTPAAATSILSPRTYQVDMPASMLRTWNARQAGLQEKRCATELATSDSNPSVWFVRTLDWYAILQNLDLDVIVDGGIRCDCVCRMGDLGTLQASAEGEHRLAGGFIVVLNG